MRAHARIGIQSSTVAVGMKAARLPVAGLPNGEELQQGWPLTSFRSSTLYTMAPSSSLRLGAMLRGTEMSTNRRTPPTCTWGEGGPVEGGANQARH